MNTTINMSFYLEKALKSALEVGIRRTTVYGWIVKWGQEVGNRITVVDRVFVIGCTKGGGRCQRCVPVCMLCIPPHSGSSGCSFLPSSGISHG